MEGNQEQPELRSISNTHSSFVKFVNTTRRNVGVYWIDYHGKKVRYKVLSYGDYLDVNTFVTHPWVFIDEDTMDRFMVNCSYVFFPEPWFAKYRGRRREELPPRVERTYVYITLPMFTLRELALRVIRQHLKCSRDAYLLDIPRNLQMELASLKKSRVES